jgi:hypothetical protein
LKLTYLPPISIWPWPPFKDWIRFCPDDSGIHEYAAKAMRRRAKLFLIIFFQ